MIPVTVWQKLSIKVRADYPIETYLLKIPTAGIPVSYAQNGLKLQPRRKKLFLTTNPALVTWMIIASV
jgi:hypothetical protein